MNLIPSNIAIKNQEILYSDTILPEEELKDGIVVTKLTNVSPFSLEVCLNMIFESNPNVFFDRVQYSKEQETVYFYTYDNKKIVTDSWEERNFVKNIPLYSTSQILEEVKRIINVDQNQEPDCISLFDIVTLFRKKEEEYKRKISSTNLNNFVIYDFDFEQKELICLYYRFNHYFKIIFSKKNQDLYVKDSEMGFDSNILVKYGDVLSTLYDELMEYYDFKMQRTKAINIFHSFFLTSMNAYSINLFVKSFSNEPLNQFGLSALINYKKYSYECNSNTMIQIFKDHEDELFKHLFVRIEYCPKWCQNKLYQMRQEQLKEIQKMKENKKIDIPKKHILKKKMLTIFKTK